MKNTGLWRWAGLALTVWLLAGCSGGKPQAESLAGQGSVVAAPGLSLPAPADLAKQGSSPPLDPELWDLGNGWWGSWPHRNIADSTYSPAWTPGASLEQSAYAIYRFSHLAEYAGPPQVRLAWEGAPPAVGKCYVGLSNFTRNRWDWYAAEADGVAQVGSITEHLDEFGGLMLVVLVLDDAAHTLRNLIIGDNVAPVLQCWYDLKSDPLLNIAPLTVNFNCSSSKSIGGVIVGFDADWESDGTWDLIGDTDGLFANVYSAGNYLTTVRCTDSLGYSSTLQKNVDAVDSGNSPPTASFTASATVISTPGVVTLNPAGSHDADGTIVEYRWDFDSDGHWDEVLGTPEPVDYGFGIKGVNKVTLEVQDNYFATDTFELDITVQNGWQATKIDPAVHVTGPITVAAGGSAPNQFACAAYTSLADHGLRYVRAMDSSGTNWGDPVEPGNLDGTFPESPSLQYNGSAGQLQLIYGKNNVNTNQEEQYFIQSADGLGATWGSPVLVSPVDDIGTQSQLLVLNNLPAIAAITNDSGTGTSSVQFYLALDNNGLSWGAAQVVLPALPGRRYLSVALGLQGSGFLRRPIVAASVDESQHPSVRLALAGNVDGTVWNTPQTLFDGSSGNCSLGLANGRPALLYGSGYQSGKQYFIRADAADGAIWTGTPVFTGPGGYGSLVTVGGKPAACFYSSDDKGLFYVEALDADGADWGAPVAVLTKNNPGQYCAMVAINNKPIIVCYSAAEQELLAAFID